ncbi:PREDICTED: putative ribonuclease H protein At1g65750-like [Fragaria vesca subsp. vesca]
MPSENCFKLNIDGSRSTSSGKIGASGVIRDHRGSWISGFQINLGVGEILDAEAWGLFYDMKLASQLQINNLSIESDSAVLVQLFQCANLEMHPLGSLLKGCKNFMSALRATQINHIFRESNMTADALVENSVLHKLGLIVFDNPSAHVT